MDPATALGIGAIAAPMIGNLLGADAAARAQDDANVANRDIARDNQRLQKEFAQAGVRWKVADAKQAGIHPLYALGANTHSYSPMAIAQEADMSQANMYQNMGQDVSRAIQATRTADERKLAQLQIQSLEADVQGKALDNQIRQSTLTKMSGTQVGPALPSPMDSQYIPGQGNAVKVKPSEVYASEKGRPGIQSGMINSLQYSRESDGNISIVPSADMKERMEDDFIAESLWHLQNRILPPAPNTKDYPIPENLRRQGYKHWFWNPFKQKFVPSKNP